MVLNEKYKLNNGIEIPKLGLGTWMIPDSEVDSAVKSAVKLGIVLLTPPKHTGMNQESEAESEAAEFQEMRCLSQVRSQPKTKHMIRL